MSTEVIPDSPVRTQLRRTSYRLLRLSILFALGYLLLVYQLTPALWRSHLRRHPALAAVSTVTQTSAGIPGDPLNVAIVGGQPELQQAMLAAGWYPADALTLRSCLKIAGDTLLHRRYEDAPVSNLYLMGRKEDLAFEKPVGDSPRQRHHVRFWCCEQRDAEGRPAWIGAATFDSSVGLSHTTGQITHHIAADIDRERSLLLGDLHRAGQTDEVYWLADFQKSREGRNGGGDPWHTDGRLGVAVLKTNRDESSED